MKVRFLDLRPSQHEKEIMLRAIEDVMSHGIFVHGEELLEFERLMAEATSRAYCTGVSSGTSAVYLALKALKIGPGDEVITSSLSWIGTANAIALTGANPVFADIDDDLNINPYSAEKLITKSTKAILSVDYTGRICKVEKLKSICKKNDIHLVEDGSQAYGAYDTQGNKVGGYGVISAISHNPMKVFSAIGEAGSITTNDGKLDELIKSLRYNGMINKEYLVEPSQNYRLDTIQAAILVKRHDMLEERIEKRIQNAKTYDDKLNCAELIKPTLAKKGERHVFYTYTVRAQKRDELMGYLDSKGIECKIQHPLLMSQQKPYLHCVSNTDNAENIVKEIISLPVHENLSNNEIEYVCNSIKEFYENK